MKPVPPPVTVPDVFSKILPIELATVDVELVVPVVVVLVLDVVIVGVIALPTTAALMTPVVPLPVVLPAASMTPLAPTGEEFVVMMLFVIVMFVVPVVATPQIPTGLLENRELVTCTVDTPATPVPDVTNVVSWT